MGPYRPGDGTPKEGGGSRYPASQSNTSPAVDSRDSCSSVPYCKMLIFLINILYLRLMHENRVRIQNRNSRPLFVSYTYIDIFAVYLILLIVIDDEWSISWLGVLLLTSQWKCVFLVTWEKMDVRLSAIISLLKGINIMLILNVFPLLMCSFFLYIYIPRKVIPTKIQVNLELQDVWIWNPETIHHYSVN